MQQFIHSPVYPFNLFFHHLIIQQKNSQSNTIHPLFKTFFEHSWNIYTRYRNKKPNNWKRKAYLTEQIIRNSWIIPYVKPHTYINDKSTAQLYYGYKYTWNESLLDYACSSKIIIYKIYKQKTQSTTKCHRRMCSSPPDQLKNTIKRSAEQCNNCIIFQISEKIFLHFLTPLTFVFMLTL